RGQRVALSLHQSVISCTEQVLMYWLCKERFGPIAPRQGSLHWTGVYQVMPCRVGNALMTPAPKLAALWKWIEDDDGMRDVLPQPPPLTFAGLVQQSAEVMAALRRWAATKDARDLFAEAQRRHLALAEVLPLRRAAESEQFRARGFVRSVSSDGTTVPLPGPLFRMGDSPAPEPAPPPAASVTSDHALAAWPVQSTNPGASGAVGGKPLQDVRVLDFTWG